MKPILLSQSDLKLGVIASMAVSPDGQRVYLGRLNSNDPARRNLGVIAMNPTDGSLSTPTLYRDSDLPLPLKATSAPSTGVSSTVAVIQTDPRYRKLYLIAQYNLDGRLRPSRHLTVYDLDANGDPIGEPRSYEVGKVVNGAIVTSIVATVQGMAFHPSLDRLYMVGHGWHGVRYYALDANGEPQVNSYGFQEVPTPGNAGRHAIAISQDGKRLYLGTISAKPLAELPVDDLQVVDLDPAGILQVSTLKTFSSNAFEPGKSQADYLRFVYTPRALYRIPRELPSGNPRPAWPLMVWPLDPGTGLPAGNGFQPVQELAHSALAPDPTRSVLWVAQDGVVADALTGVLATDRMIPLPVPIDKRGFPALDQIPKSMPVFLQEGVLTAVAINTGMPIFLTQAIPQTVNYHKNYHVRLTILEAETITPPTPTAFKCTFTTYSATPHAFNETISSLALHQPSPWQNLDELLRDRVDQALLTITVVVSTVNPLKHLRLQLEVALGDLLTNPTVYTLTETVVGNQAQFLLPGYRQLPTIDRAAQIETLSHHSQIYLQTAQSVALTPEERPRQFTISCSQCVGGQGHLDQLENQVTAIKALGFNTAMVYNWGTLGPAAINGVVNDDPAHPFHSMIGVYNPLNNVPLFIKSALTYFAFCYDGSLRYKNTIIDASTLDLWAEALAKGFQQQTQLPPSTVLSFAVADEPAWVYPPMLRLLSETPSLEDFNLPNTPPFSWVDAGPQPNRDSPQPTWGNRIGARSMPSVPKPPHLSTQKVSLPRTCSSAAYSTGQCASLLSLRQRATLWCRQPCNEPLAPNFKSS
jgi:hypothetical protein